MEYGFDAVDKRWCLDRGDCKFVKIEQAPTSAPGVAPSSKSGTEVGETRSNEDSFLEMFRGLFQFRPKAMQFDHGYKDNAV